MTQEEQICALAELDGWKPPFFKLSQARVGSPNPGTIFESLPPYLTSYDAILPLVQKQTEAVQWVTFVTLAELVGANTPAYLGKPAQICEALLRVWGKWGDE